MGWGWVEHYETGVGMGMNGTGMGWGCSLHAALQLVSSSEHTICMITKAGMGFSNHTNSMFTSQILYFFLVLIF